MSLVAIHDSDGRVICTLSGSAEMIAANTPGGGGAVTLSDRGAVQQELEYIDLTGTPSVEDRPAMGATLPEIVPEGELLSIAGVPSGATIEVTRLSDGAEIHSGAKGGGTGVYDAAMTGESEGDLLFVAVRKFPAIDVTGVVEVVAPL